MFCAKHGIKSLTETLSPLPHQHSITFGKEKRKPEIRLLSQTGNEVPNFDHQLQADKLKKGTKFHLLISGRHIKKGTKFRLSIAGRETQITHVLSFKRNKKVPFSSERVFLTNAEKRHNYLVTFHESMDKNVKVGHILETKPDVGKKTRIAGNFH